MVLAGIAAGLFWLLRKSNAGNTEALASMTRAYESERAARTKAELDRDVYFAAIGDLKHKLTVQESAGRNDALIRSLAEGARVVAPDDDEEPDRDPMEGFKP